MNLEEMAQRFNLPKEQVERVKAIFQKLEEPGHKSFFCESCTGEYYDWQLIESNCPLCLTEGDLQPILEEGK